MNLNVSDKVPPRRRSPALVVVTNFVNCVRLAIDDGTMPVRELVERSCTNLSSEE